MKKLPMQRHVANRTVLHGIELYPSYQMKFHCADRSLLERLSLEHHSSHQEYHLQVEARYQCQVMKDHLPLLRYMSVALFVMSQWVRRTLARIEFL